jgi:prepilin-type N-terminal cleavage/methylation domain-containing protein
MNVRKCGSRLRAMSLIELLVVIAIITLLAALLLPALGQAKARAWRIQCTDHLHEVSIGFAGYANDHDGRFPMAVPSSAGGTLELARSGSLIGGDFYYSYRHFQAAGAELVTPRLLVCPADTRPPASSFATLNNANLSYFAGVNAEFSRPGSILAGDRNLTNDHAGQRTTLRLGPNDSLRWTAELHHFKGNLAFADAHVEQRNNTALFPAPGQGPTVAALALPTVPPPGHVPAADAGTAWSAPQINHDHPTGTLSAASADSGLPANTSSTPPGGRTRPKPPPPPKVEKPPTNAPAPDEPPQAEQLTNPAPTVDTAATADTQLATSPGNGWFWSLLVLIALATLLAALRRDRRKRRFPSQ